MSLLAAFAAGCVIISITYYVGVSVLALRFARKARLPSPALPKIVPRVAILKPLHGLSPSLPENLMSYLELDYRRVEYLFGVSGYEDCAADAVVALKPQYGFAQSTLVVGEEPECSNLKVAKLIRMAERAHRAEIVVLSDADVSVERNHLQRIVGELYADERLGAVTCLYRAKPNGRLASRLEALFVNTDFVPLILVSKAIEPVRYTLGATVAIKREALEAIGGFRRVKDLLADDYYLGQFLWERGYRIKLSSSIVTVKTDQRRFGEFWRHQLRWARTYRTTRPVSLATIILYGPFWGLVLLAAAHFSWLAVGFFAGVIAARIAMSRLLIGGMLGLPEHRNDGWWAPLKDLVMTAVWAASLFSNDVLWGGRRLKILQDGTMLEVGD